MPSPTRSNEQPFARVTSCTIINGFTSTACIPLLDQSLIIPAQYIWEITGFSSYPVIINCTGQITLSSDSLGHRDFYEARRFESIPCPKNKWGVQAQTLMYLLTITPDIHKALELTWSIDPRYRSSCSFHTCISVIPYLPPRSCRIRLLQNQWEYLG